ncbi:MAG: DUF1353 domain-containing protein [Candidatus Gastranaerophilales bacterium]|nr:DUF1353 domain-containing protein [Candidatus Gastranaerophilales bacterium]MCM1072258.1 DUF1353 domain-containing protein [Bacteroides sp.]
MLEWYKDKSLGIFFSDVPHVCVRYILPTHTDEEKKSIKKYPFICKTELKVILFDYEKSKSYNFTIPKGYCYDGASIPRLFWRVVGSPTDNKFLIAALIHDVLCENHNYVNYDRAFSTNIFNALLTVSDVNCCQRFLMKNSVACFQTIFCRWKKPVQEIR